MDAREYYFWLRHAKVTELRREQDNLILTNRAVGAVFIEDNDLGERINKIDVEIAILERKLTRAEYHADNWNIVREAGGG